jgi:hypothetical protein
MKGESKPKHNTHIPRDYQYSMAAAMPLQNESLGNQLKKQAFRKKEHDEISPCN